MYRVTNKAVFDAKIAAWMAGVRGGAERVVTNMLREAQLFATEKSPIYSGDFASNWNVSWGTPDRRFEQSGRDYYGLAAPGPVDRAWGIGNFPGTPFRLGQKAYLTNAAEHEEPYAWKIENNKIEFRPVNAGKDRVAGKTWDHLRHTYATIKKGMMV